MIVVKFVGRTHARGLFRDRHQMSVSEVQPVRGVTSTERMHESNTLIDW